MKLEDELPEQQKNAKEGKGEAYQSRSQRSTLKCF